MLQQIRERISGWIAGVVIALVAGAFMLFGVEYYFEQGASNPNAVAKVNSVTITDNQLDHAFSELQRQALAEMHGQPLSSAMTQELKSYALQSLVTQTALFSTLQNENYRIGLTQVKAMVEQAPQFQDQGKFSEEKLMQTLYQASLSPLQFFQQLQSQWIVRQVVQGVAASGFVLSSEVNHFYALAHQKRAFGYLIVPAKSFLSTINITDEQIKNEYTENQSQYQTPATVSVSYIELSPKTIEKNVVVTVEEAQRYYQTHLVNYQVPERWQVSQITIPVAANASASDVKTAQMKANAIASAFQENKETGYSSSTITLSAAAIDPALHTTLSGLQTNTVSAPLRTQDGFTLLKILKIMPAETHSFDSVKNNVMQLLQRQRVNELLTKKSRELSDLTYTNPDSLEAAAKKLHLTIQTSPMITKSGEKTGIFADPTVLAAIFSDSVFKSGNNSNPINLRDGSQIVLRIGKKIPSKPILLATVSAQIKTQLAEKQAMARAGLLAYQLQKKISSGENAETVAKQNKLEWHSISLTSRDEKSSVPQNILTAAFHQTMGTQAVLLDQNDYAVIAISQVKNADSKNVTASAYQKLNQQLSALWGQLLQHYFVKSVISDAHIVVKQK